MHTYLRNNGEFGPEVMQADLGHLDTINSDATTRSLNDAEQSHGQRRLSCSCTTHYANLTTKLTQLIHSTIRHSYIATCINIIAILYCIFIVNSTGYKLLIYIVNSTGYKLLIYIVNSTGYKLL